METSPDSVGSCGKPDCVKESCDKEPAKEDSQQPSQGICSLENQPSTTGGQGSPSVLPEGKDKRTSLECVVNPPVPSELDEAECAVLRGDAIGNTAYTHRWVLNTLLTITQAHLNTNLVDCKLKMLFSCSPPSLFQELGKEALPQYLATDEKPLTTADACSAGETQSSEQIQPVPGAVGQSRVVELGEEVENAACQLWDMSAEPDVVEFLLQLEAIDVLQLANDIITHSCAPRLTEVIVGVVANLCCQGEGCEKVLGSKNLLPSCLALLHSTDDVPTLIEAFRLLRLLLWHATYRIPMEKRSKCPLIMALKSNETLKESLVFMLKNSLSDALLSSLMEFLESLTYLWLPTEQCYMAAQYSESGLVEGVVEVMRHFLKAREKSGGGEQPAVVHRGLLILYSFVSTPAVQIISSFDQYEPLLEPILVSYVEHLAKVEDVSELLEGENSEQLVYALGLCELLVPTMRNTNILLPIGKLLALTHGAGHHYTPGRSQSVEEVIPPEKIHHEKTERRRRRSRKRSSRSTSSLEENMETDSNEQDLQASGQKGEVENSNHGRAKKTVTEVWTGRAEGNQASSIREESNLLNFSDQMAGCSTTSNNDQESRDTRTKLNSMIESLVDYCVRVVRCCPDLCSVFTTLNECHVHEVQLFFKAVKSREPTLVGQLQEQLLDTGSHNRLVTILSDMYT